MFSEYEFHQKGEDSRRVSENFQSSHFLILQNGIERSYFPRVMRNEISQNIGKSTNNMHRSRNCEIHENIEVLEISKIIFGDFFNTNNS